MSLFFYFCAKPAILQKIRAHPPNPLYLRAILSGVFRIYTLSFSFKFCYIH